MHRTVGFLVVLGNFKRRLAINDVVEKGMVWVVGNVLLGDSLA
jgi:hypothetical protein